MAWLICAYLYLAGALAFGVVLRLLDHDGRADVGLTRAALLTALWPIAILYAAFKGA